MSSWRKYPKLAIAICVVGFVLGLFIELEDVYAMNSHEMRVLAGVLFAASIVFPLLFALIERLLLAVVSVLRRVANSYAPKTSRFSSPDLFFEFTACFFFFVGIGFAASSLWKEPLRFWQALVFAADGLGLIVGSWLATRIFWSEGESPNA